MSEGDANHTPGETAAQPGAAAHAADAEARAARIAEQEGRLRHFGWLLGGAGAVLVAGGAAWRGVDFAVGVLLGFLIVALNFYWTKKVVKSVLLGGQPKGLLGFSFLLKFGLTGAVLVVAILRLHVDGLGVLLGLSALVVATALYALELTLKHG